MPTGNRILKVLLSLGVLVVATITLGRRRDDWEWPSEREEPPAVDTPVVRGRRRPAARFALTASFACLFFAGAAFTAGAGDQAARLLDDDAAALEEAAAIAAAGAEPAEAPVEPVVVPAAEPAAETAAEPEPEPVVEAATPSVSETQGTLPVEPAEEDLAPAPATETSSVPSNVVQQVEEAPAPVAQAQAAVRPPVQALPTKQWVVRRAEVAPASAPEIERELGEPTVWLNRALPDPTPPSARLARSFARELVAASTRRGADWASVLGVLRAQGERGSTPAGAAELDSLAARLAGGTEWRGALALSGRTAFADRAKALADLYRSVGIEALVVGYEAASERLAARLLGNGSVLVYAGGRDDLAAGRIDVRVVVLLGYLAERHGSVTVSSLFAGHRKYSRPGVVSAHMYGQAVDIAAVGGSPIAGNQQPGGLTEDTVRSVLLLPAELQPRQVISLLGLGGASFPLRDHGNHIHVGF